MYPLLLSLALVGPPDDVLVILLDDVGKDLLSVYEGQEPAQTPNIDLLAASGRVYDRAYGNPLCAPARACLLTGRYGFRTGLGTNQGTHTPFELDASEECVPELLASVEDLSLQVFNKWHLSNADGLTVTDRHAVDACGFEHFFGHVANLGGELFVSGGDHYRWRSVRVTSTVDDVFLYDGYAAGDFSEAYWATAICKDELVASFNGLDPAERAVFFWEPVAPHAPFQAPPPTLVSSRTMAGLTPAPYRAAPGEERPYVLAMLEAVDTLIGEALAEIAPARRERLNILLIGDNGTARQAIHSSLDPLHAKGTVYELGIGVPLIVCGPSVAAPGTRDASLVHMVDVAATVVDLVGAPAPVWEDAVSFYPTFAQGLPGARETVFSERFEPNGQANGQAPEASIRTMLGVRYKLIRNRFGATVVDELYDLVLDPTETIDLLQRQLTGEQQAAHDQLRAELEALIGPQSAPFCDASDGALAACPCGNAGSLDTGCDITQGTGGVRLALVGQVTSPVNRATLAGAGFGAGATPAIVLRAGSQDDASPVVFGDGLRCVGVPLVRFAPALSSGGVSTHVIGHGASATQGTSFYQLWFRNSPPVFCDPAAAFALSSGRTLSW